jgi:CheY-like chemotaxis protein
MTRETSGRVTILVADDEPLVGRLVERALGRAYAVTVVHSGREALDRFEDGERWDLVLCDLMMPEVSGMEVYERILAAAPDQATRMVFLTGGAYTARTQAFLDERPYLDKPFDLAALEALVADRVGTGA